MIGTATLHSIVYVTERLSELAAVDRDQFHKEPDRQWAATLLLICVGNAAKRYEDDVPSGPGTFTGIVCMRDKLAHQMLQDIDMSIVWRTARINGPSWANGYHACLRAGDALLRSNRR